MEAQLLEYDGAHLTAGGEELGEAANALGTAEEDTEELFERAHFFIHVETIRNGRWACA